LQNSVVPTPIMALPDQKLVVPRHYRHIGLRRPCVHLQVEYIKTVHFRDKVTKEYQ